MGKESQSQPRQKKSFWKSWIPWKGDSAGQVILKIITLLMLIVFLVSAGYLVNELIILPAETDKTVDRNSEYFL